MKRTGFILAGFGIALGLLLALGLGIFISRMTVGLPLLAAPLAPTSINVGLVTDGPDVYDESFNELSYMGVLRAESELGITYQVYTSASEADYLPNLQQCATDGNTLCIAVGFLMADAISQTAALYPGTTFAIVDHTWETAPSNLRGMTFASEQAGYLAGTLAALMSDSGTIGAVAGMEIPSVQTFVDGYYNGAQCAAPATTVLITYTGTFVDPGLGAQAAQQMLGQGADVIFGVGGETGNGAILTTTQSGMWGIGVDVDQYDTVFEGGAIPGADHLLSSALKRVDNAIFDTIADVISGTFTFGTVLYTVAEDGVGLAPFHETDPLIPQSVRSRISGVEQGLREGWLDVDGPCVATIGVAVDLSGPVAELGWQEANAVQLVISQTNAAGGLTLGGLNYMLHLSIADDACDATQAVTAAQALLDAGALAVVGHTCSNASMPAQAAYAAAGVSMISPSSTRPDLTQMGFTTTFRTASHDGSPAPFLATYFRNWMGFERSAIVQEAGAEWLRDLYSDTFTALGGAITSNWVVTDTADFTATLESIKSQDPDVIFVAGYAAAEPGQISRIAYELGMNDVPIAWDSMNEMPMWMYAYLSWAGAEAAQGDFIAMHQLPFWAMPGWETLVSDYQAAGFANVPDDPGTFGAFAYDAAGILIDALTQAGSLDGSTIRDAIAATTDYDGVVGSYEGFDANGDLIPQWMWIARYQDGDWRLQIAVPDLGNEWHVCASGCDFSTIQDAVNAATDGDTIKVAAGTYSDLHSHTAPPDYYGPSVITQVVHLDKALTLRGGYSTSDWDMPAPLANVTTIDAQGGGRAIVIAGTGIAPVIEGFHVTGGGSDGMGGHEWAVGSDAGGGFYVSGAAPQIQHNWIYGNHADFGGAIFLDYTPNEGAILSDNEITGNTAYWGGGLAVRDHRAVIVDNLFANNHVSGEGPGARSVLNRGGAVDICQERDPYTLTFSGNTVISNTSDAYAGGIAVSAGHHTFAHNVIQSNTAITGGGVYLDRDLATFEENRVQGNQAELGAGFYLYDSGVRLQSNEVLSNTASRAGGGIQMYCEFQWEHYASTVSGNTIRFNTAMDGGGIGSEFCPGGAPGGVIQGNTVSDNRADRGAGMSVSISNLVIDSNFIARNIATDTGGGIQFHGPGEPKVLNNVIVQNHADHHGGAVLMIGAFPQMVHTTIVGNTSGDGSAVYIEDWLWDTPTPSDAYFENVILADSEVGIKVTQASTVTVAGVLWYNVSLTTTQSPTASVTIAQQITGDPAFMNPASDDYHIGPTSAAIDRGIAGGLEDDMDGQPRPMGMGYDIGADEYPGAHLTLHAETPATVLLPGQTFTYSLALANDGALTTMNALLTFTLNPQQRAVAVTPGGVCAGNGDWGSNIVCPLGDLPPGAEAAFVVTAQVAATIPLGQVMESTATATADATASSSSSVKTVSRARLVYPLSYEPDSLDVNREAYNLNSLTLLAQLMEAPYRYGTDGSLIPAGATGYTVSPDGLVYTVTLRADARWSDGVPVTAQHYVDSVIRALDPAAPAGYAYLLYIIQGAQEFNTGVTIDPATVGVAAIGVHTLRFTLHTPAAYFPSMLAASYMYPVRVDALNTLPFIGNGPYRLQDWEAGRWFILDKNPYYHSIAQVITSRILMPIIPDEEQVAAYEAGLLDVSAAPDDALGYIMNDPVLSNELRNIAWPGLYYLGLNSVLTPTNDLNVRMALASAIDRIALMNSLNTPWREAATSVIPPGIPGYQNGAVGYPYNAAQAQAYLAAAGFPGGAGFPGIELWAYPGTEAMLEAIADDWRTTLNISVTLVYIDRGIYYNELRACLDTPGECSYNVYRAGWWLDYADANNVLNDLFHPDGGNQYTYWDSVDYRQLMELQLADTNPAVRIGYLQEADRVLVEDDAVIVPVYFLDRPFLIKPNLTYEYPSIGGPRLMVWQTAGTAAPCYVRVSSMPGITYSDVQTAVDAAKDDDTVKVAGTCVGVHARAKRDLEITGTVTQVVYINKNLMLQGGYTTTNWLHSDPGANPTTLDAQGQGRVIYVTGDVTVTIAGLRMTGGDAVGQSGSPFPDEDSGGGVYAITATVTLEDNEIFDNVANGAGGGANFHNTTSLIRENKFTLNRAGWGGGLNLQGGSAMVVRNNITVNRAADSAGGVYLHSSAATLDKNDVMNNNASHYGGGVYVLQSDAVLTRNVIRFNTAEDGGGVELNRAGGRLANNVIADNFASHIGSGVYLRGASPHLLNNTIARNYGGDGTGLHVTDHFYGGMFSSVMMTNTILVDHSVGITLTGGNALFVDTVLWHNTLITVSQSPTAAVTLLNDRVADPLFDSDGYHLRPSSPALDTGIPVVLSRDIDGDPRPYGSGFDVGADEVPFVNVEPEVGATLVHTDTEGTSTTVVIPPDAVSETTTVAFALLEDDDANVPPELVAGGISFALDAYQNDQPLAPGTVFSVPVTVTLVYSDADVAGMDETSLKLYRYVCADPESMLLCVWEVIGTRPGEGQTLDVENNVLTAWLVGFSRFKGMGVGFEPAWQLSKTYAGNRVAGTAVTYTLTVTNTGAEDATAVTVEDKVSEYLAWSGGGTFELGYVRWYFEAIMAGSGTGIAEFSAILPCTTSLAIVNDDYRVTSSAQGVTSTVGPPVSFTILSPTITVEITHTPHVPVVGDPVYFTATVNTDGAPLSYQWGFGGSGPTTSYTYVETGTYTVAFTATDTCGYFGVDMVTVNVGVRDYEIYLPLVMRQ